MSEPWFRRRWYGWLPIHRNGWIIQIASMIAAPSILLAMLMFASINIWISATIFVAFIAVTFPLNALIRSRTEKR